MNTLYSHSIRILTCRQCGAPFEASLTGGQFQCQYCAATNVVVKRDEQVDRRLAAEGASASISESERFAQLRVQSQSAEPLPAYLGPWLSGSRLHAGAVPEARAEWQRARQQIAAGSAAFSVAERLFYLTVLLVEHIDPRSQRATLETAAELLTDPRHRHVVRSQLARLAAQNGDLEGAAAWLQTCNPRPRDLVMDTAYRLAAATVATARRQPERVFELLGHHAGEVPLAERDRMACEVLRVNALEQAGQAALATNEVHGWIVLQGPAAVAQAISAFHPLPVLGVSYQQARHAQATRAHEQEIDSLVERRQKVVTGVAAGIRPVMRLPVLALILLIPLAAVRCSFDADPLAGVYGLPLCPRVCDDCHGPTRTVTIWTPQGAGEWTSNGAEYFCSRPGTELADWDAEAIEAEAYALSPQQLGASAALGASFLLLYLATMLFAPALWFLRHAKNKRRAARLDQEIHQVAQRLGRAPPDARPKVPWSRLLVVAAAWHGLLLLGALGLIALGLL
ncbi:MAG: hypothetical protein AB8I08_19205 [Sandaracinaceae bacterium]